MNVLHGIGATVIKEWRLLSRDLHGLVLLFLMPAAFILIMSLALQNTFDEHRGAHRIAVCLSDPVHSDTSQRVHNALMQQPAFAWHNTDGNALCGTEISSREHIRQDKAAAWVSFSLKEDALHATVLVAPSTSRQTEALLTATLEQALGRERMGDILRQQAYTHMLDGDESSLPTASDLEAALTGNVSTEHGFHTADTTTNTTTTNTTDTAPDSVQQNVPAWLVFAMFFSVVPLSSTLITERQQGTLRRLRTLPVSPALPLLGKLLPYFLINQLQVVLMLAIGLYVTPWLGANSLSLGSSPLGLALISVCTSLAALGYGILVAVLCKTSEQATLLGGTGNLLLAAIGGIMVPRFVMPEAMQNVSQLSPMSWALDGFLDLFLRHGTMMDVLPEAAALSLFGAVTMTAAFALAGKRT